MTKTLLGGAAAIAIGALAFASSAEAQCWWTKGYNWQCSVPSTYPAYYPPGSPYYSPPTTPYYYSGGYAGGYPNHIYPYSPDYPPYWVTR